MRSEAAILIHFKEYRPWLAGAGVLLEELRALLEDSLEKVELTEAKVES